MFATALALLLMQTKPDTIFGQSGLEIVKACQNARLFDANKTYDEMDLGTCMGYLTGVVDGSTIASKENANQRFPVCIPTEVTRHELALVVLKYADDHPEQLHKAAVSFVTQAFALAYPCKKQG